MSRRREHFPNCRPLCPTPVYARPLCTPDPCVCPTPVYARPLCTPDPPDIVLPGCAAWRGWSRPALRGPPSRWGQGRRPRIWTVRSRRPSCVPSGRTASRGPPATADTAARGHETSENTTRGKHAVGKRSVYNSSWPEIRLRLSGEGWGVGGGGGSSADSASTLLTLRTVYVLYEM